MAMAWTREAPRRACGLVALPCLLAGMATESHAAHVVLEATPIRVRYSQGELTNPAAARHLLKRIGDAALESCGASTFSVAEVKTAIRASRCWKDAVDDAIRRIGSPVLSAALVEDR